MAKKLVSATVDIDTDSDVRELAETEKRSFSSMVDVLLREALDARGVKKKPKKKTAK